MKILVTNYFLRNFTGSEINTLQICSALNKLGHQADAGTFFFNEPIKRKFQERNIRVKNLLQSDLQLESYEFFWTHHIHTINHLIVQETLKSTKIIYSCLGPFSSLAAAPIYHNELNCILSNSRGNNDVLLTEGLDKNKIRYFPNFSPESYFSQAKAQHSKSPSRIAVISNHPPQEISKFSKIAKGNGQMVDFIGQNANHVYVDPDVIKKYDLVISIGKTVQYCFALRVPIYCYDHFGGPGFITPDNIQFEEFYNFSGRGTNRKLSGQEILTDIAGNYSGALNQLEFLYEYGKEHFTLENNIQELFADEALHKNIYISDIRNKHPLIKRHHNDFLRMLRLQLTQEEHFEAMPDPQHSISSRDSSLLELEQEVLSYSLSRSWRITRPLRKLKNLFRKDRRA